MLESINGIRFSTNRAESLNRVIKHVVDHKKLNINDFVEKLRHLVLAEAEEVLRALDQKGDYIVHNTFRHCANLVTSGVSIGKRQQAQLLFKTSNPKNLPKICQVVSPFRRLQEKNPPKNHHSSESGICI